jgi:hypothetical protein
MTRIELEADLTKFTQEEIEAWLAENSEEANSDITPLYNLWQTVSAFLILKPMRERRGDPVEKAVVKGSVIKWS